MMTLNLAPNHHRGLISCQSCISPRQIPTDGSDWEGHSHWTCHYVNAYKKQQLYGGPEEGGWYWDLYEPLCSIPVRTPEERFMAEQYLRAKYPLRASRWPDYSEFYITTQPHPAQVHPTERPRYE